ncbi:MAG: UPF0175 family protein [Thermoanaerobacteraceae bacterium]|nr:UPF0175 family protein [Thermoanaerobacteraceae bacterium]
MAIETVGIHLDLPKDTVKLIESLGISKSVDKNIKQSIAIALFISRSVSLARAAEIAELPLGDFAFFLKSKKIPWGEYTEDEMLLDELAINDIKKELGKNINENSM